MAAYTRPLTRKVATHRARRPQQGIRARERRAPSTKLGGVQPEQVRVARGAWVAGALVHDLAARCSAVLDGCPPDTVSIGATAARLHGMWLPDLAAKLCFASRTPDRVPSLMNRSKRPQLTFRRMRIPDDELTVVDGVPVTTIARTWRDLARELGLPALVAAGDSALRLGATLSELDEVVRRGTKVRGIVRARAALPLLDARSRSRPESHLRVAVSSLPVTFEVNEPVYRRLGGWLAEPDLSRTDAKIALEYQGSDHADPEQMRKDMTRFADLRSEGWLVLPYGPAEVFRRPWQIENEVRAAFRERAPHLLRVQPSR